MRIWMPVILIAFFVCYLLYEVLFREKKLSSLTSVIYPGVFFIAVWSACYFILLK